MSVLTLTPIVLPLLVMLACTLWGFYADTRDHNRAVRAAQVARSLALVEHFARQARRTR